MTEDYTSEYDDYRSPHLEDFLSEVGTRFRDWGDKNWENQVLNSGATKLNEFGFDPFGMSPAFIRKVIPIVRFLYRGYFRVRTHGLHELPTTRLMFVANHSGQLPFDGSLIAAALAIEGRPPRILRSMVERWVPKLPFVSLFMARCGQVLGDPDNSRRLLENDEAILVFPEGVRGISKLYWDRYKLKKFSAGFMRLAMETGTPIVPVAVVGAEEAIPAIHNSKILARLLGAPAFPITPTFPWIFPWGILPYPVKIHLYFGEPMSFSGDPNDEDEVIESKVAKIQDKIQQLVDRGLKERGPFPISVLGGVR
jgi:1-acyl-sn-glycerol-3-phosphate acyltransferase